MAIADTLQRLIPNLTGTFSFSSQPPGARLSRRAYGDKNGTWQFLGVTPLNSLGMPRASEVLLELIGYRDLHVAPVGFPHVFDYVLDRRLGGAPDEMVRVGAWTLP